MKTSSFENNSTHLYNLSLLEEMDDNEYVLDILTTVVEETPKDLKEMKDALKAGKTDMLCKSAHKAKSSAGIIQAAALVEMLTNIENLGKKGLIDNNLIMLTEQAVSQYGDIEKGLKIRIQQLG